jgi:hypothetical protein
VDDLPEPRNEVQPGRDRLAHGVDPQPTGRIQQDRPVEDREGADVLRPPLARPQHQPVE